MSLHKNDDKLTVNTIGENTKINKKTENYIDINAERMDELNINGWKICQNSKLFRFGIDAVLLAGFASVLRTDRVIDLCSGSGIIPFLYLARADVENITAVEYFEYFCQLMKKTAAFNGCSDNIDIVNADIKAVPDIFKRSEFDVVTVNPPYEKNGHGIDCPNPVKNAARRETLCDIDDVARAAAYLLKPGGRLYMIHRPGRICDVLCALRKNSLEPRTLKFVQSRAYEAPNLVLISAVKDAPPYLRVEQNLIIYNADGSYTKQSSKIYDHGEL